MAAQFYIISELPVKGLYPIIQVIEELNITGHGIDPGGIPPPWLDFITWLRRSSVPHFNHPHLAFLGFSHLIPMTQCLSYRRKEKIKIKEKRKKTELTDSSTIM